MLQLLCAAVTLDLTVVAFLPYTLPASGHFYPASVTYCCVSYWHCRILIVAALTPPTTKYKHLKSMTEDGALLSHALQQYGGWVPYMQFLDPAASPRSSATVDSALLSGTAEFISSTVKRVLAAARSPALGVVHQVVIVWLSHGGIESGSRGRGQFVLADDGKRLYLDELEALADRYKVALLQLINACRVACKSGHSNTRSKGSSSQSVPASRSGDWSNGHWLRLNATETWRESYGMLNAEVSPIAAEFLRVSGLQSVTDQSSNMGDATSFTLLILQATAYGVQHCSTCHVCRQRFASHFVSVTELLGQQHAAVRLFGILTRHPVAPHVSHTYQGVA